MRYKGPTLYMVVIFSVACLTLLYANSSFVRLAYSYDQVQISKPYSYVDSNGNAHVVGLIKNHGYVPLKITVALKTLNSSGDSEVLHNTTLGSIVYPFTESPFKFDMGQNYSVISSPYIEKVSEVQSPFYEVLFQNYTTMNATGGKILVGTVKNIGNVILHNVSVYASVHQENGTQIDSVKTITIPILRPGDVENYVAKPHTAVQFKATYFSCAGLDLNAPINTLVLGNGQFLPYSLESAAKISDFKYNNDDDSLTFVADHYNPVGGIVELRIPQVSDTHTLTVLLDHKIDTNAKIAKNGKTGVIDIFIPPESHQVEIKGVLATIV
jgi:hypothetical protein